MNKARHLILSSNLPRKRELFRAAKAAKVSVDDLVQAGLGRSLPHLPALVQGKTAAHLAAADMPEGTFKGLDAWPYVCRFCGKDHGTNEHRACPLCGKEGCAHCVGAMCPVCKADAAKRKRNADVRSALARKLAT